MANQDRIEIRIDESGMEAWIKLLEGPELSADDFDEHLVAAGITHGLNDASREKILRALAEEGEMSTEVSIARGLAAQPGTPPSLALNDPTGLVAGVLLDDDRLDFRQRLLIVPVVEGEEIGHIVSGVEGKAGWDVHGEDIPPTPLEEITVKHGEGVSISPEGILLALRAGARTIEPDGKIDVVDHHVHKGHVDLSSGNLDTRGSLEVSRDVTTGMCVRSSADLKIGGTVDGGRVYAGGSVEIVGGAIGREAGAVYADGDLSVRHALGIRLQSKGRITIARSVSTSQLVAKEIEIQGKMLSDSAEAESLIIVQDAGSPAGGPCVLRAAYPIVSTRRLEQPSTDEDAGGHPRQPLKALRDRKGRDSRKGRGARVSTQKQLEIAARREWRTRQRELQKTAFIEIRGTARAGCRIDFGVAPLVLETNVGARRFRVDPKTQKIIMEEIG